MWETLTGGRPVGAFPRLHSIVKTPPALDRIIRRALDPDPDKRYPSIEAFAKALRHSTRWHASWWKPLLVLLLAAIPCIVTAKHFLTPPPVPIVREITFPMRIQSGDLRVAKAECQAALANHTGYGRLKDTLDQIDKAINGGDYIDPLKAHPPATPPNPIPPP